MAGVTIEEATRTDGFTFEFDAARPFAALTSDKEVVDSLSKWGLPPTALLGQHYRCDTFFRRGMADEFILALFNDPSFAANFRVSDGKGGLRPWSPHAKVRSVKVTPVRATLTSLDVFDAFDAPGIVRESGHIARCMDIYLPGGVTVANLLRAYFLVDPEEWPEQLLDLDGPDDVIPAETRDELLVRLMKAAVAGGALCQWDDEFEPYKDAVRALYKDLVVVGKRVAEAHDSGDVEGDGNASANNGPQLEVQSLVYQVHAAEFADGMEVPLFPRNDAGDASNYMYVAIHPHRRTLSVLYHGFASPF